jgi:hypothetical protein
MKNHVIPGLGIRPHVVTLAMAGAGMVHGIAAAAVTPTILFGDSYIVKEGAGASARFYSVLDVYIKCSNSADIISSVFGVTAYTSAFTMNQGDCFVHSNSGPNCWKPACGQPAWDSFLTCGCRDQCAAVSALSLLQDTNWQLSCCAISGTAGGPGWYPGVGASTSTNPYARSGYYNGNATAINTAKATTNIAGNGITVGQNLNNHWMIGRFAIDVTGNNPAVVKTMTLKFAIAGKQNGTTTFTGSTSSAGRFNYTLTFAPNPCVFEYCPTDLDANGAVDSADLAQLLLGYGACSDCRSDFDASGFVDTADLALVLLDFGPCGFCPCGDGWCR